MDIIKLSAADLSLFKEQVALFAAVFETEDFMMPKDAHLQRVLAKDSFFSFVALEGSAVIGGLTAHVLEQYYSPQPQVYLYDLAIATEHQRKGIGKKLVSALLKYCKSIGIDEMFVQADAADLEAIAFYKATGGQPADVLHFSYVGGGDAD